MSPPESMRRILVIDDSSWAERLEELGRSPLLRELRKPFNRQDVRRLASSGVVERRRAC